MVIKVAWIVAEFIDEWRNLNSQSVVFLQIDREIGCGASPDGLKCSSILLAIDCDAHDARSSLMQGIYLFERSHNILRVCGRHALGGNGVPKPNGDRADLYRTR